MISEILEKWYEQNKRDLPWRNTDSPYKIWLSEIILQQTRVNQGIGYYQRFVGRYPQVEDLAKAPVDEVLKMWQGLGYYSRARNLHATANAVVNDHGGMFPDTYEGLLKLKGIGAYTAAAVASFAFKKPVALVDGNVSRVLARLYDNHVPVNSSAGKKTFMKLAGKLLNPCNPYIHNQALMEFGALVCLPQNPRCHECVLAENCMAKARGTVSLLPVRKYSVNKPIRYFNYLFIINKGITWIRKREGRDIWNSLFEFPLVETAAPENFEELVKMRPWRGFIAESIQQPDHHRIYRHKLSHQTLICNFHKVISQVEPQETGGYIPVELSDMDRYAIPKAIDRYLEDMSGDGLL